jgi:cytochrome P450
MVPRASSSAVEVHGSNNKTYYLPPKTSVILNICAIHYNEAYWPKPTEFDPFRFMGQSDKEEARVDASLWL